VKQSIVILALLLIRLATTASAGEPQRKAILSIAAAAVFTNAEETINSTVSTLTFSFPGALQYPTISPTVQSKQQEINLDIEGTARTTTSGTTITRELTITNSHG
jgi:hypothetical protein